MAADEYIIKSDGFPHIDKDPNATKNYSVDWSVWLARQGEASVQTATAVADAGVTIVGGAVTITGGKVTSCVVSGGTVGKSYKLTFHIVTPNGLSDDKTIVLDVVQS